MKTESYEKNKLFIVAVDLFCGIGGLTYGLNKSGIKVVAGVDVDERCKFAFEKNNDSLFINKSIKDVSFKEILRLKEDNGVRLHNFTKCKTKIQENVNL